MYEERTIVPERTKLYYGIAAPQTRTEVDKDTGDERTTYYPGGAEQIVIDDNERNEFAAWKKEYRYVTVRQLDDVPSYPYNDVDKIIQEKKQLHPILCPRCRALDVSKTTDIGYVYECKICSYIW